MTTWTTNDGRLVDMAEMSNEHLANAAAMVKRRLIREACRFDMLDAERGRRAGKPPAPDYRLKDLGDVTYEFLEQELAATTGYLAVVVARETRLLARLRAEIERRAIPKAWQIVEVVDSDLVRWRHASGRTLLSSVDGAHVYWMRDAAGHFIYRPEGLSEGSVSVAAAIIVDAAIFGRPR